MRKLNWVARGLLVCLFMGVAVLAQAQDQPNTQLITPGTITRGDEITITGTNLSKNGVRTVVEIDGREAERVEVAKDSVQIKAVVESAPLPEKQQRAGEYTRAVVVKVGEQVSNTYTLRHVTWRAVLAQQVWVAIVLYLALVVAITLGVKASVFRSATGPDLPPVIGPPSMLVHTPLQPGGAERNPAVTAGSLPGLAAGSPTRCAGELCYAPAAIPQSTPSLPARCKRSLHSETRLETSR